MYLNAVTSLCVACVCMNGLSAQEPIRFPTSLPTASRPLVQEKVQPPIKTDEDEGKFTPPSREELYRVDSEATKFERVRQLKKALGRPDIDFPDEEGIRIKTSMEKRHFDEMKATVMPSYVVYQPLYFQQINTERYGWELGIFQPVVSTAQFYGDVLLFPYKFAANPPWHCDSNAGYALPGDPEPLRFLTMPFSWRGVFGEAGAAVAGAAIFP